MLLAIVILSFVLRMFIAWAPTEALITKVALDDSFYMFTAAKNVAEGNGIASGANIHNNGYQPLWMFFVAPVYMLFKGDIAINIALSLAALLDTITVVVIFLIARGLFGPKVAVITAM